MVLMRKKFTRKYKSILLKSLTMMIAPDSYGKTFYLKQFLKKEAIENIWIDGCLQESIDDFYQQIKSNTIEKNWIPQKICNTMFSNIQEEATFLKKWDCCLQENLVIVIDDFHQTSFPSLISLIIELSKMDTKHIHFVLIAPYLSDLRLINIFDRKLCHCITIKDFKIDGLELLKVFKKKNITFEIEQLDKLLGYTKGWPPALELAIKAYEKGGSLFDTSQLEELLNKGKFNDIKENDIIALIKLSILPEFKMEQAHYITNEEGIDELIINLAHSQFFIEKTDMNAYSLSPIFKNYLYEASARYDVSIKQTYELAANWFMEQSNDLEAIRLLMAGGLFESILQMISEAEFSYTDMDPELIQEVFHRMPKTYRYQQPFVYLSFIRDMMTNIDPYKAMILLEDYKEDVINGKYNGDKDCLMGEYYYIRAFSGFNDVSLMMADFHKAHEYLKGEPAKVAYPGMIASFGSYQLLYLYHHTPGKLKELTEVIKEEAKYFIQISHGCNAGSELQVQAEYGYVTGDFEDVERLARAAYKVAYLNRQTSICICSCFQLGRLAYVKNNHYFFQSIIDDLYEIQSYTQNPILQKEVDCAVSYLYIINEKEDKVAKWIIDGSIKSTELMYAAEGLPYITHMLYLLKKGKYMEAESCCTMIEYNNQRTTHAFAILYAMMARSIIYFHTNREHQSLESLSKLLHVAKKDNIVSIFIEFSNNLYPLFVQYKPKDEFEEEVYLHVMECRKAHKEQSNSLLHVLSKREKEIASLYIDSFTSKEIAEKLLISHNTVLTHLKTIYAKLEVNKKKELVELLDRRKIIK